jgi:hypothetical protein
LQLIRFCDRKKQGKPAGYLSYTVQVPKGYAARRQLVNINLPTVAATSFYTAAVRAWHLVAPDSSVDAHVCLDTEVNHNLRFPGLVLVNNEILLASTTPTLQVLHLESAAKLSALQ